MNINPPARTTQIGLSEYMLGEDKTWNKSRVKDMLKNNGVTIITKKMDDQLNVFYKDTIPLGQILGDSKNSISKWNRYFDNKLWGAYDQEVIYYEKRGRGYVRTHIGKGQIEAYKQKKKLIKNNTNLLPSNMQPSTALDNNSIAVNTLDNYTKAQANALKYPVKNKGISIFDFDGTVAKTKSKVIVTMPQNLEGLGKLDRLLEEEFAKSPHTRHLAPYAKKHGLNTDAWFWKIDWGADALTGRDSSGYNALVARRKKIRELDNFEIDELRAKYKKAKGENKENIEIALQEKFKKLYWLVDHAGIDIYTGKDEIRMELTPAEFAEKAQDLESQGAVFDFFSI